MLEVTSNIVGRIASRIFVANNVRKKTRILFRVFDFIFVLRAIFPRYIIGSNETLSGVLLTILSATVIFIKFSSIKFIQSSNISFHVRRVSRLIDPLSLHDREPRNANCFSSSRSIGSSISRDLVENRGSTMTHGAEEIDPRPRIHSSQNIPALLYIAHVPNQIKINRPVHSNIRKIVSTDN